MKAAKEAGFSRRHLLQVAGLTAGGFAFPERLRTAAVPPAAAAAEAGPETVGPVMTTLSSYMSLASGKALPDEVTEKTKRHVLDTLAAMISGSALPPGRAALDFAVECGGKEVATVVASKLVSGPIEAALTNAMLAHADETDDSHPGSQSHPGCAVIPAALAAGEQFSLSAL